LRLVVSHPFAKDANGWGTEVFVADEIAEPEFLDRF
jgi:hypothetical protein